MEVDGELAYIIEKMKESNLSDRAIRNYAKKFLGMDMKKDWGKKYEEQYG